MTQETQTPTGVFVRLPLSEDDCDLLIDASSFAAPDGCHNTALLAIGTPVAVGGLKIWGNVSRENAKDLGPQQAVLMFGGSDTGADDINLVDAEDAQAALAAAQAEIVRLREHLTSCTANLENVMTKMGDWCGENGPPEYLGPEEVMSAMDAYETGKEALKGPAA